MRTNFSLHIVLKKAASHIDECFVMSFKRRGRRGRRKRETPAPNSSRVAKVIAAFGEESRWDAQGSSTGM